MTDKELLELAAKASCIKGEYHYGAGIYMSPDRTPDNDAYWNPLTKDGDALRLAIETDITIDAPKDWGFVYAGGQGSFSEPIGDDKMAAVRRAIVRAAADIGKDRP
jgi:hypothetical protein